MGIGISLRGLKNKFNELMGRDKKKDDTKKSSESLESKEETRFDDTSPTKSKKTTASTDLDNTKNGASSGSVNSGEVHVGGLGQTTPAENTTPPAKQPSAGSRPPMPPRKTDSETLSLPSLHEDFSNSENQKQVIEKFLKNKLEDLIKEAKEKKLLDDSYNYNENIKCYGFDYPAYKFLENVRVFWLKIAEIIYREIPSNDISYEIINFQNQIGNCLQRTEMQSLLSTNEFYIQSKNFLGAIKVKIEGVSGEQLLEDKKNELIRSKGGTLNKLVSKYNELYENDKHKQFKNESLDELQQNIAVFWLALKAKFEQGEKYEERKKRLDDKIGDFDSTIENNREMGTFVAINNVGEALDQKFNIIGRVILYLEKRKNKEVKKQAAKDSGILGGLVKRFTKTEAEKKTLKLKKCFEDMGKYLVKHKGEKVKLSDFRKLVKCKKSYSDWNEKLNAVLNNSSVAKCYDEGKNEKKLLMSILFFSFAKFNDEKDIIAACDGLKAGGIKSTDPDSFEGKATSIRKAIKGKCATLNMANDPQAKTNLKNDIKSLCMKYFGLDMSTLTNIGNIFGN